MTTEERYREALFHVIKFLQGDGGLDYFKPLPASRANEVIDMCRLVLQGKTTEEAIKDITNV